MRNSASAGIRVQPDSGSAFVSVDRSHLEGTTAGCGMLFGANALGTITSSVLSGNKDGVCVSDAAAEAAVHRSLLSHNAQSGLLVSAGTGRLSRSLVTGNAVGLANTSGLLETLGTSLVRGNGTETSGPITPTGGR